MNFTIVLAPHCYPDIEISQKIYKNVDNEKCIMWDWFRIIRQDNITEGLGYYKHAYCVIAMRGHAQICPIGMLTPVISICNHPKHYGILNKLNIKDYAFSTQDEYLSLRVIEKVKELKKHRDIIIKKYDGIINELNNKIEYFMKNIETTYREQKKQSNTEINNLEPEFSTLMNKHYDFVCSLGGSCAVAKQLKFKGLRKESLPFDWLFHLDNLPLQYLNTAFKNNFNDFLQFDALRELTLEERGDSPFFQYKDETSGYNFIHDFHSPKENSYKSVLHKYKRRIFRLQYRLFLAKKVLFILDSRYQCKIENLKKIKETVESIYGCKVFFVLLQFNASFNGFVNHDWIDIYYRTRNHSMDDYNAQPEVYEFIRKINIRKNKSKLNKLIAFAKVILARLFSSSTKKDNLA